MNNPYKAVFDQIDSMNRTVWYRDIKIYGGFDWDLKKELSDQYGIIVPKYIRTDEYLDEEEATRVLVLLDYVGYKHKRYEHEQI